jgi:hypothetical protein
VNDPESELTPATRALLARARGGDALPKAHRAVLRRRLAGALGVVAPFATSTSAAASLALWAARGIAVIGAAGVIHVAAHGALSRRSPHASPATRTTAVPAMTASVPPPPPPPAENLSAPPFAPVEVVPVAPFAPAPARTRHAEVPGVSPAPSVDALEAEVRIVAEARAALVADQGARALTLLADHDQRFAAGVLSPEADALRIEALCEVGRHAEAQVEAERFVARHPGSPLARRFTGRCAAP